MVSDYSTIQNKSTCRSKCADLQLDWSLLSYTYSYSQPRLSHRLTSWRWCCLSDSGTEWSSDSSAGNCCHLNGVTGRGYQQSGSVGSLTLVSPRHRNIHCTATTSAVAYNVSCNVTVSVNAWDTTPSNDDANRAGSHGSDLSGWFTRSWGLEKRQSQKNCYLQMIQTWKTYFSMWIGRLYDSCTVELYYFSAFKCTTV